MKQCVIEQAGHGASRHRGQRRAGARTAEKTKGDGGPGALAAFDGETSGEARAVSSRSSEIGREA